MIKPVIKTNLFIESKEPEIINKSWHVEEPFDIIKKDNGYSYSLRIFNSRLEYEQWIRENKDVEIDNLKNENKSLKEEIEKIKPLLEDTAKAILNL